VEGEPENEVKSEQREYLCGVQATVRRQNITLSSMEGYCRIIITLHRYFMVSFHRYFVEILMAAIN
jgi:hypothetical protein